MRFRSKSGMTKQEQFQLQQKKQALSLKPAFLNQIMNAI